MSAPLSSRYGGLEGQEPSMLLERLERDMRLGTIKKVSLHQRIGLLYFIESLCHPENILQLTGTRPRTDHHSCC
jgi:hypothetical protein